MLSNEHRVLAELGELSGRCDGGKICLETSGRSLSLNFGF